MGISHSSRSFTFSLKLPNVIPMWKPLPPSGPPASSGQLTRSVLVQLDDRTVHAPMILRGIPYNEATTRDQIIALFSRAPPLISPQTKAPTYPPNEPPRATLPPPGTRLTLESMRDSTREQWLEELNRFNIPYLPEAQAYEMKKMVVYHYNKPALPTQFKSFVMEVSVSIGWSCWRILCV